MRQGRRLGGLLAVVLVALGATTGVATAADKDYTVALSPTTVPAGSDGKVLATVTNTSRNQQLGSFNLTLPGALRSGVTVAAPGTQVAYDAASGTVQARNLSLAPGGATRVTVGFRTPCAPGTHAWAVQAKQANDFNGTGNDLARDGAPLTTTVTGSCGLAFAEQPHGAVTDQGIGPVRVTVVTGDGAVDTSSTAPVTITKGSGPDGGAIGGTRTVNAVKGVATFDDLYATAAGTYTLVASSAGRGPATSGSFDVGDTRRTACDEDVDCSGALVHHGTLADGRPYTLKFSVFAPFNADTDAGTLLLSWNTVPAFDCLGYTEVTQDRAVFDFQGSSRDKLVTYAIDAAAMGDRTAASLEACFAAPYPFVTDVGYVPSLQTIDGATWYVGVLPDCVNLLGQSVPAPCTAERGTTGDGFSYYKVKVAATPFDPATHG